MVPPALPPRRSSKRKRTNDGRNGSGASSDIWTQSGSKGTGGESGSGLSGKTVFRNDERAKQMSADSDEANEHWEQKTIGDKGEHSESAFSPFSPSGIKKVSRQKAIASSKKLLLRIQSIAAQSAPGRPSGPTSAPVKIPETPPKSPTSPKPKPKPKPKSSLFGAKRPYAHGHPVPPERWDTQTQTAEARGEFPKPYRRADRTEAQGMQAGVDTTATPEVRPHIKVRIVTWNMHDSLPTGDLTELFGEIPKVAKPSSPRNTQHSRFGGASPGRPPSASSRLSSAHTTPYTSREPSRSTTQETNNKSPSEKTISGELPQFPLDDKHPFHLVVVGGQECPSVAAGDIRAWGKPTWTDILEDWLSGGTKHREAFAPPRSSISQREPSQTGDDLPAEPVSPLLTPPHLSSGLTHAPSHSQSQLGANPLSHLVSNTADTVHSLAGSLRSNLSGVKLPKKNRRESSTWTTSDRFTYDDEEEDEDGNESDSSSSSGSSRSSSSSRFSRRHRREESEHAGKQRPKQMPKPYVLVAKERLMGIYISVWVWHEARHLIQGISKGKVASGLLGGRMGNKGCSAISVKFAGSRLLFMSAHLAAHQDGLMVRRLNIEKIKSELQIDDFLPPDAKRSQDCTSRFDQAFLFGDLNFRLTISRLHADWLIKAKDYANALEFDQLKLILNDSCFRGFREAPIRFAPTYKYDLLRIKRRKSAQRLGPKVTSQVTSRRSSFETQRSDATDGREKRKSSDDPDNSPKRRRTLRPGPPESRDDDDDAASIASSNSSFEPLDFPEGLPKAAFATAAHGVQRARVKFLTMVRSKSAVQLPLPNDNEDTPGISSDEDLPPNIPQSLDAVLSESSGPLSPTSTPYSNRLTLRKTHSELNLNLPPEGNMVASELRAAADAVFDSSSKQRVQSWTDRILFKTTLDPSEKEPKSGLGTFAGFGRRISRRNQRTSTAGSPVPPPRHSDAVQPEQHPHLSREWSDVKSIAETPRMGKFGRMFNRHGSTLVRSMSDSSLHTTVMATSEGAKTRTQEAPGAIPGSTTKQPALTSPPTAAAAKEGSRQVSKDTTKSLERSYTMPVSPSASQQNAPRPTSPITHHYGWSILRRLTGRKDSKTESTTSKDTTPNIEPKHIKEDSIPMVTSPLEMSPAQSLATLPFKGHSQNPSGISQVAELPPSDPPSQTSVNRLERRSSLASLGIGTAPGNSEKPSNRQPQPSRTDFQPAKRRQGGGGGGRRTISAREPEGEKEATPVHSATLPLNRVHRLQEESTSSAATGERTTTTNPLSPNHHHHNNPSRAFSLNNVKQLIQNLFAGSLLPDGMMGQQHPDDHDRSQTSPSNHLPPPEPVGPRKGEIEVLDYNSVNDLRRMEAWSDHRPVVGAFAIGV